MSGFLGECQFSQLLQIEWLPECQFTDLQQCHILTRPCIGHYMFLYQVVQMWQVTSSLIKSIMNSGWRLPMLPLRWHSLSPLGPTAWQEAGLQPRSASPWLWEGLRKPALNAAGWSWSSAGHRRNLPSDFSFSPWLATSQSAAHQSSPATGILMDCSLCCCIAPHPDLRGLQTFQGHWPTREACSSRMCCRPRVNILGPYAVVELPAAAENCWAPARCGISGMRAPGLFQYCHER